MSSFGYSPIFPLINEIHGAYSMHQDLAGSVKQNVKIILLTNPGERIMSPHFGVGLKRFLFEQNTPALAAEINNKISEQFKRFMPFLSLRSSVVSPTDSESMIKIEVAYKIRPLSYDDRLKLKFLSEGTISRELTPGERNLIPLNKPR